MQGMTGALHNIEWEKDEQKAQREEIGCAWV